MGRAATRRCLIRLATRRRHGGAPGARHDEPLAHLDLVATVLLPLLGFPIGWAKPVAVNPLRFRRGIRMGIGVLLVAAAGPFSNVCLAAASAVLLCLQGGLSSTTPDPGAALLKSMVIVNVVLAVFNLLPVPPLDGSRIVDAFVPRRWRPAWDAFSRLGPILLILVIFLPYLAGLGVLDDIEAWVQDLLTRVSR